MLKPEASDDVTAFEAAMTLVRYAYRVVTENEREMAILRASVVELNAARQGMSVESQPEGIGNRSTVAIDAGTLLYIGDWPVRTIALTIMSTDDGYISRIRETQERRRKVAVGETEPR